VTASSSGGIGAFTGTSVSMIFTTSFTTNTCTATTGYGGCFAYTNTAASTLKIANG
jgi:hypothetical protein